MSIIAAEAAGAGTAAGSGTAGGLAAAGSAAPGIGGGDRPPGGSSVAFAIAILLIGGACIGLWIAFHSPEDVETGGFPGLFAKMLRWVHAGEQSAGADAGQSSGPSPGEAQQIRNLPKSVLQKLQQIASGGHLGQWGEWFLHLPL